MSKKRGLYSVVDYVNKVCVVEPTVMLNDLTAATAFYQSFGVNRKQQDGKPDFKMLCLYKVANIVEEEGDDEGYIHVENVENPLHLTGSLCKEYISNEYCRLGLDDPFLEDNNE